MQPRTSVTLRTTSLTLPHAFQYDAPGGHKFQVSGLIRNLRVDGDSIAGATGSTNLTNATDNETAYGILAAAAINLADIATLTGTFNYGDGIGRYLFSAATRTPT